MLAGVIPPPLPLQLSLWDLTIPRRCSQCVSPSTQAVHWNALSPLPSLKMQATARLIVSAGCGGCGLHHLCVSAATDYTVLILNDDSELYTVSYIRLSII